MVKIRFAVEGDSEFIAKGIIEAERAHTGMVEINMHSSTQGIDMRMLRSFSFFFVVVVERIKVEIFPSLLEILIGRGVWDVAFEEQAFPILLQAVLRVSSNTLATNLSLSVFDFSLIFF